MGKDLEMTDEERQMKLMTTLENAFNQLLASPYQSFHSFVRATSTARELNMQDQYQEVWNHWRESWSVGEGLYHLRFYYFI